MISILTTSIIIVTGIVHVISVTTIRSIIVISMLIIHIRSIVILIIYPPTPPRSVLRRGGAWDTEGPIEWP